MLIYRHFFLTVDPEIHRIARLMSDPQTTMKLPSHVDPRKLANQDASLQGAVPPEELPRLADAVLAARDIQAEVVFSRDAQRRTLVEGEFTLQVEMTCQRCLQPVAEAIEGSVRVGVVWDESRAAELPRELDPWIVDSEIGDLYALLEDEFLLALPIAAFHDKSECAASGHFSTGEHEETRENPFSVLAKLKQ